MKIEADKVSYKNGLIHIMQNILKVDELNFLHSEMLSGLRSLIVFETQFFKIGQFFPKCEVFALSCFDLNTY